MANNLFNARALAAVVVLGAASSAAYATPVFTPFGAPFPAGSSVTIAGGFTTPLGAVDSITLNNFSLAGISTFGGNQTFTYSAHFHAGFKDAPGGAVTGAFDGDASDFIAELRGRPGLFTTGTYSATLLSATFTGLTSPGGLAMTARLNPELLTPSAPRPSPARPWSAASPACSPTPPLA